MCSPHTPVAFSRFAVQIQDAPDHWIMELSFPTAWTAYLTARAKSKAKMCIYGVKWLTVPLMKWCRLLVRQSFHQIGQQAASGHFGGGRNRGDRCQSVQLGVDLVSCFPLCGLLFDAIACLEASFWNQLIDQKQSPNDSSRDCSDSAQLDQCQIKNEFANHLLPLPLLHQ